MPQVLVGEHVSPIWKLPVCGPAGSATSQAIKGNFLLSVWELGQLAQAVWVEAQNWQIELKAKYLAGSENIRADRLSQIKSPYEWKLNPRIFQSLDHLWGPHTIDRCASLISTQLPVYNSLFHDPSTAGVDCTAQRHWGTTTIM